MVISHRAILNKTILVVRDKGILEVKRMEKVLKGTTISQHENLCNLLKANGESLIHPRTRQTIIGTSLLASKKPSTPYGKNHLCRFPRVAYNRRMNQTMRNGYRIIIENGEIVHQKYNKTDGSWEKVHPNCIKYKPTSQYKTVWYSKGMRRQ